MRRPAAVRGINVRSNDDRTVSDAGQVAVAPDERYHTGRPLAARLGDDQIVVEGLPDRAVESSAGVGNPFSLRQLAAGERVVDVRSGAGFDSFVA